MKQLKVDSEVGNPEMIILKRIQDVVFPHWCVLPRIVVTYSDYDTAIFDTTLTYDWCHGVI